MFIKFLISFENFNRHSKRMPMILLILIVGLPLLLWGAGALWFRLPWPDARLPVLALWLLSLAQQGPVQVYALGNWPAPFGIQLLLDRLSALLLLAVSVLACAALLYAIRGDDKRGLNFHALFQFQLAGLNGAFLTGDLFNLFVFFEILLIASYALLLHGLEATRVRAGLHYVLLNLTGSALFLIALLL